MYLRVKVEAVDQGQPQKTAIAYLVVHVLPRNFTGIAFVPPIMRVSVVTSKLKPKSIMLASSELAPNMFEAGSC